MNRQIATLAALAVLVTAFLVCPRWLPSTEGSAIENEPQRRAPRRRAPRRARTQRRDYSEFSHSTAQHRRLACDSCHTIPSPDFSRVREGGELNVEVTDYPGHSSCIDCHRQQFFRGARPEICSICHTNVSPRDGSRFPFPRRDGPKTVAEFAVNFPHDRHLDVMALRPPPGRDFGFVRAGFARQEQKGAVDSCSLCHKTYQPKGEAESDYVKKPERELEKNELRTEEFWFKFGMLKTTETGHASCFSCHWQKGGVEPLSSDCAGCHKLASGGKLGMARQSKMDAAPDHPSVKGELSGRLLESWKLRRAARFRHEISSHSSQDCATCHVRITASDATADDMLYVPIQTCASSTSRCHGSTRVPYNIINRELEKRKTEPSFDCTKCHINLGREAAPASHTDLFPPKK